MGKSWEELIPILENDGEERVRQNLVYNRYTRSESELVDMWLIKKEYDRHKTREDLEEYRKKRNLTVAESARIAAWFAVIISAIGIVISTIAVYLSLK
jgi:hypothetical protein